MIDRLRREIVCPTRMSAFAFPVKGKARKSYEFGAEVAITTTYKERLIVGSRSMRSNPYDGHTPTETLRQAAFLSDVAPEVAIVDRGSKGVAIEGVKIYTSTQTREGAAYRQTAVK